MAKSVLGDAACVMQGSEFVIPGIREGETVHLEFHLPNGPSVGTVLLLHGLGDHVGRHDWAFRVLTGLGFEVVAFDWPGCGKSSGIRGDLPTVSEAAALVGRACETVDREPIGVVGHSTGGFFLPRLLELEVPVLAGVEWVWFSSPLIDPAHGQNRLKISLAKKLAARFPAFTLSTGVKPRDCYHPGPGESPNQFAEGVHSRISLRFGAHLLEEAERLPSGALATLPSHLAVLLTQGSADTVCPTEIALRSFGELRSTEKVAILAVGSRHEPFRESNRDGILNGLRSWLRTRADLLSRGG